MDGVVCLTPEQCNPTEVQHLIVEHVVNSQDVASQFQFTPKWRAFSGIIPCPTFDYDTWCSYVEFYSSDHTASDIQLVQRIVESLLSPASDVVKLLGPNTPPRAYLDLLDAVYGAVDGAVDDSDELFANFLNTNQNGDEHASTY